MCAYCSLVDLWSPGASERRCILMYFCSIYFLRDPRFWSIDCFLCSSALLSSLHYFVQTLRSQGPVCMDMGWAEWSNGSGGKTKFSALPLSVSGLCCFPSSHVLAEYLVGTLPGTLQWEKRPDSDTHCLCCCVGDPIYPVLLGNCEYFKKNLCWAVH